MSSRGKRRKAGKTGGRKRKAGGGSSSSSSSSGSSITVAKCEGHAASLLSRVDDLRRSHTQFCDLRIRPSSGEGGEVAAHSLIMAATSPYVLSKLTRWRDEQEEGGGSSSLSSAASSSSSSAAAADDDANTITITIPDLDAASLNAAVHFAYTGTVELDKNNRDAALPLIAGLQLLDMEDAIETVQTWVGDHLDPTSALRVQHTAESLHLGVLKARADEFIDQNFEAVTKTEEWQMLPAEAVGEVLSRDKLRPGGEIQVFHALVRWATCGDGGGVCEGGAAGGGGESKEGDHGDEGREAQFVDLLGRCVRASQLSSNDLSLVVLEEPLVQGSLPAVLSMTRVLQERAVDSEHAAQFASPEPLCRRRADAMVTKIFAVGGEDGTGTSLSSVECVDPSTGVWSVVAAMSTARDSHGVAVVDGKLYAVGGDDDTDTTVSSVECFDPSTGVWSAVAALGTARSAHGVAVVGGKLYAVSGDDEDDTTLSSVECFDPSTGVWSAVAALGIARSCHGVAGVDGKIYAVGGYGDAGTTLSSVECFDPSTGQWSAVAAMSTARYSPGVTVVDGKLYVVGGADDTNDALSSVECFDLSTGVWSAVAAMSTARCGHGVAVVDGKLYAVGGLDGTETDFSALSSVECFDPSTGVWSAVAAISTARSNLAAVAIECPAK
jgi:N-acetylneuraminic acid mutarotase